MMPISYDLVAQAILTSIENGDEAVSFVEVLELLEEEAFTVDQKLAIVGLAYSAFMRSGKTQSAQACTIVLSQVDIS